MRNLRNTAFSSSWFGPAEVGLALVFMAASALNAQEADPAARAVRLSSVDGQVQVSQNNQVLADPALANMSLFEGTQITTRGRLNRLTPTRLSSSRIISWVTSKSVMAPFRNGRTATM